jgi:rubredoxin
MDVPIILALTSLPAALLRLRPGQSHELTVRLRGDSEWTRPGKTRWSDMQKTAYFCPKNGLFEAKKAFWG